MKYALLIISIIGLFLGSSCNQTEEIGDELTDAERRYIRQISYNNCINETNKAFEDLIEDSNAELARYQPKVDSWKLQYKRNGSDDPEGYILFWKNAAPNFYFVVVTTSDGVDRSKFYKVTTTTNAEMFRDLQEKKCSKASNITVTESSTSATLTKEEDPVRIDADNRRDTQTVYNYSSTLPALFGYLASKRTVKTLDNEDNVTKTETYEYIITPISDPPTRETDINMYAGRRYHMLTYTPAQAGPPAIPVSYPIPYNDPSDNSNINTPIDANGDSVADFTPVNEL